MGWMGWGGGSVWRGVSGGKPAGGCRLKSQPCRPQPNGRFTPRRFFAGQLLPLFPTQHPQPNGY